MRDGSWKSDEPARSWVDAEMDGLSRPSILVVEDDADIRDLLVTLLELAGFAAHPCGTAEDGLNALREEQFDLVLTDYSLPHRSGAWLLKQASEEGLLDATPAMVVTAHPEPRDTDGFEVVSKPFDLDDLVERVRRRVGGGQGERRRPFTQVTAPEGSGREGSHDDDCREPIELILYVSAHSPRTATALENVRETLKAYADRVTLTVHDLATNPGAGAQDNVTYTPTLVKRSPGPRTFILGHLTNPQILLDLLDECED